MSSPDEQKGSNPAGPEQGERPDPDQWERQKHQDHLVAINALTKQLAANQKSEDSADNRHASREQITLWLVAFTLFATGVADVIFYCTMRDARTAAAGARKDSKDALDAANSDSTAILDLTRTQFRQDERPYVWFTEQVGFIDRHAEPNDGGQLTWTFHFTNYGKSPAYNVIAKVEFWIDGKKCLSPKPPRGVEDPVVTGAPLPPNKNDFATAVSCTGIGAQRAAKAADTDKALKLTGAFTYQDAYGAKYVSPFCMENLRAGAIRYCTGNDIK